MAYLAGVPILAVIVVAGCTTAGTPTAPPVSPSAGSFAAATMPSSSSPSVTLRGPAATPSAADVAAAVAAVDTYTRLLVQGNWSAAFAALAPSSREHWGSLASFTYDRAAYFKSVAGKYEVVIPGASKTPITDWLGATYGGVVDLRHSVLVEVDYPAIAQYNAYSVYIVAPTPNGLVIYDVR